MANDGKELEGVTRDALKAHQKRHRSNFLRLYDSTTAKGAAMPPQPGDFVWLLPNAAVLIECKSTEKGTPILQLVKGSKTSRDQVPRHKVWHLSGHPSVYLWGDLTTRVLVAYLGASVVQAYEYNNKDYLKVVARGSFPSASSLVEQISDVIGVGT